MRITTLLLAGSALFAATSANAAPVIYTTLASFNAATSAQGTDTYTGFNISGTTASPINRSAGVYTYTATATVSANGSGGFYGAGTPANPYLSTTVSDQAMVFSNFTSGVTAIGGNFFASDLSGAYASGGVTVTFVDASGTTVRTITPSSTTAFLGFVSNGPITSLTIVSVDQINLFPTVDNLVLAKPAVGTAVPEPTTWAMMIVGFGMVGGAMRRRSTKVAFAA